MSINYDDGENYEIVPQNDVASELKTAAGNYIKYLRLKKIYFKNSSTRRSWKGIKKSHYINGSG